MHFLGLLGGSRVAGTNGPDRLICNNHGISGYIGTIKGGVELLTHNVFGVARIALWLRFANADHGYQVMGLCLLDLRIHIRIRQAKELSPLGVAYDDVGAAHGLEHRSRHFAREGTLIIMMHVLSAESNRRFCQLTAHCLQVYVGRAHQHIDGSKGILMGEITRGQRLSQRLGIRERGVHLPVSSD